MEIAHAFNNLLTVIGGSAALLDQHLARGGSDPDVQERLADIRSAVEEAGALTRQMMAFARQPLQEAGPPLPATGDADASIAALPRQTPAVALLVEDDPRVRRITGLILERAGFVVVEAADGLEALAVLETHNGPIDILVCDLVLPRMGGREVLAHATALRPGLRALFVSGGVADDPGAGTMWQTTFLPKPFRAADLIARAAALLDG